MTVVVTLRVSQFVKNALDTAAREANTSASALGGAILEQHLTADRPELADVSVHEPDEEGQEHRHRMEFPIYETVQMKAGRQWAMHRCRCGALSPRPYLVTRPKGA